MIIFSTHLLASVKYLTIYMHQLELQRTGESVSHEKSKSLTILTNCYRTGSTFHNYHVDGLSSNSGTVKSELHASWVIPVHITKLEKMHKQIPSNCNSSIEEPKIDSP